MFLIYAYLPKFLQAALFRAALRSNHLRLAYEFADHAHTDIERSLFDALLTIVPANSCESLYSKLSAMEQK